MKNRSLPSNQTRQFGSNPPPALPRSSFNLSRSYKTTFDASVLIPFDVFEYLPGDTHKLRVNAFARLATPIKPIMDNLRLTFHFWACPNRQLWQNWEKFMGEQENPGDSTDYLVPTVGVSANQTTQIHPILQYMGVPTKNLLNGISVSALPLRMYNRVWNYHYRDENLQSSVPMNTGDGPDSATDYDLLRRGKRFDYFTSALPFRQKGDPVQLPLGLRADIASDFTSGLVAVLDGEGNPRALNPEGATDNKTQLFQGTAPTVDRVLYADLATATAATITDIRQAIAVQHMLERDARGGTRYPEILQSHFRVTDPSMMVLQRPEFLGGGSVPISISPVPQTSGTATDPATGYTSEPQGNLAAVGTATANGIGFTKSFTEHGYVMGIFTVQADLTYQQGLERHWSRRERFDYYFPSLANLSEQAILSKEIYCDGSAEDDSVWGYTGIYDEYRFGQSKITGRFNSKDTQTLDVWHLSQQFTNRPLLSGQFIEDDAPIDRVIAVQDEPHFLIDLWINHVAARPMPINGVPGLTRI